MNPTIRMAEARDAEAILEIYAPFCRDTIVTFETDPPGVEQMRQRIGAATPIYPWLVNEVDSEVTGYAYASRHRERASYRWAVDVTIYVASGRCGAGIGRSLYTSLLAVLRLQGFAQACAGIALPNPASVGLHEAMGFRPVGVYRRIGYKLGAWHDVGWWQLSLQEHGLTDTQAHPQEPRLIADVAQVPQWSAALHSAEGFFQNVAPGARSPRFR